MFNSNTDIEGDRRGLATFYLVVAGGDRIRQIYMEGVCPNNSWLSKLAVGVIVAVVVQPNSLILSAPETRKRERKRKVL